jgi:hypothetical protein
MDSAIAVSSDLFRDVRYRAENDYVSWSRESTDVCCYPKHRRKGITACVLAAAIT